MSYSGDKIILKGIRFHGYHGTSESERRVGQKYEVDVELTFSLATAGSTDDIKHTVDYAGVVNLIVKTGTEKSFRLIEALAEQTASRILKRFTVDEVRITVKKLCPPIERSLSYAAVQMCRRRGNLEK
ncbi:MAG: dihydroneopterin aldolase [Candidatus Poribacteria bacterium]|nr:dihydroneopterin aldolase [Candidatus Poribacteria bacterium]MDE0505222.1 dihydroneopterin aldolase [Candidatus Poribacteria bacterium]